MIIMTRFPFIEKQFHEFNYHGDILKPDGEYFARKVKQTPLIITNANHDLVIIFTKKLEMAELEY